MGNICPEEELDDHTWEFLLRACEEDEDSDMSQRKCAKTRESTEQSSAIDIGSMNPAMASVVCGGGARSETQPHVEQQVIGSSRHGGGHGGDGRSSCGARLERKEAQPCAPGTLDGTGQSKKRRYARQRCLDIFDYMIKNTNHPDNPPDVWDDATELHLCSQKTVNRYAGYLTDDDKGHKTPSGGTLAIGTATDYLQDFLQALNTRFITSQRAETKLFLTCLKRVSCILHSSSAHTCACIDSRAAHALGTLERMRGRLGCFQRRETV